LFDKDYIPFSQDEVELKFYFMLDYETRVRLIKLTCDYLEKSVEQVY